MPNLSIKNVSEEVVARLRAQAASNHRSLQGELMELVCKAVEAPSMQEQARLERGWKTIDQILKERGPGVSKTVGNGPMAVDILRQERDAR